jgi:hypothetical protein
VAELAEGTRLTVIGPAEWRHGTTWWYVEDPAAGVAGWIAEEFLRVV